MTKDEIQRLARKTLLDHGLYSVPVNPVMVATRLGVHPLHAVFSEPRFSGITTRRSGNTTILVNTNDSPGRKRFTVAHELGHYILHLQNSDGEIVDTADDLHRTMDQPQSDWTPARRREYEANVFAAELLMPGDLVKTYWLDALPSDRRTLSAIAEAFQVSEQAMSIRLAELGLATHD